MTKHQLNVWIIYQLLTAATYLFVGDAFSVRQAVLDDLPRISDTFDLTPDLIDFAQKSWFPSGKERHGLFVIGNEDHPFVGMVEIDCRLSLSDDETFVVYAKPPGLQFTNDPCLRRGGGPILCNLYILPEFRRQGLGTMLAEYAFDQMIKERWYFMYDKERDFVGGFDFVQSNLLANNTIGFKFFQSLGYRGLDSRLRKKIPELKKGECDREKLREMVLNYEANERNSTWATKRNIEDVRSQYFRETLGYWLREIASQKLNGIKLWFSSLATSGLSSSWRPPLLKSQTEIDAFEASSNQFCIIGHTRRSEKGNLYYYPWENACCQIKRILPDIPIAEVDHSDASTKDIKDVGGQNILSLNCKNNGKQWWQSHFELDYKSIEDIVEFAEREHSRYQMFANYTRGLPVWAKRSEAVDSFGCNPRSSDVGAIHLQVNSTYWESNNIDSVVDHLAKRQLEGPNKIGFMVERVPDTMPSSVLQYIRYRDISTYVITLEGTEDSHDESKIKELYAECCSFNRDS